MIGKMKIRLIIPQCRYDHENKYCDDAWDYEKRVVMSEKAIDIAPTDLIVTSNNFFAFRPTNFSNAKNFIIKEVIPMLNEGISQKIPIVLGFDLFGEKALHKDWNTLYNPYKGIDSIVCFLDVKNNHYEYRTHVWECWADKRGCDQKGFLEQNESRVFTFRGIKFGLLSCGDIAMYCHARGELLPEVDVYLDLSHRSLRGHCSQNVVSRRLIGKWRKCSYVFITQQVVNVQTYIHDRYRYILPKNTIQHVRKLLVDKDTIAALVDIDI